MDIQKQYKVSQEIKTIRCLLTNSQPMCYFLLVYFSWKISIFVFFLWIQWSSPLKFESWYSNSLRCNLFFHPAAFFFCRWCCFCSFNKSLSIAEKVIEREDVALKAFHIIIFYLIVIGMLVINHLIPYFIFHFKAFSDSLLVSLPLYGILRLIWASEDWEEIYFPTYGIWRFRDSELLQDLFLNPWPFCEEGHRWTPSVNSFKSYSLKQRIKFKKQLQRRWRFQ